MRETEKPSLLVVTNTIHPYQRHNISVLSLLPGTTYRFRYESSYFLEPDKVASLEGQYGLLVLRDFERAKFIPLRTFRCFRVEPCGDFIFLELEFLSFVKFESVGRVFEVRENDSPEKKQEALKRHQEAQSEREKYTSIVENIIRDASVENKPGQGVNKLIVPCPGARLEAVPVDDRSNESATVSFWSRIVTLLGGIASYQKACFYLLGSIRDLDSGHKTTTFQSAWRRGYKLYANRGYALQVFQLMAGGKPPQAPGFTMKLTTLEKHILPMRSAEPIDGAYDRLEFYFYVLPQTQRRSQSVLVVECDQKLQGPEGGGDSVPIPGSLVHTLIKWTKWEFAKKMIFSYCLFVAGILVWFYSSSIAGGIGHGLKPEHVQLVALFLLAVAAQNWGVFTDAFKVPGSKA